MSIPTFLINLASRPDRLAFAQDEAKAIGMDLRVVQAIPAAAIDPAEAIITGQTRGRIACWTSHVTAWEMALECSGDFCLILEDDVRWLRNPMGFLARVKELPSEALDLLQLGSLQKGGPLATPFRAQVAHRLSKSVRFARRVNGRAEALERWLVDYSQLVARELEVVDSRERIGERIIWGAFGSGTHAYILNKRLIPHLLQYNRPTFLAADDALSALAHQRTFRVGELEHGIATQAPFPSDLR